MKVTSRLQLVLSLTPILPCAVLLGGLISPTAGIAAPTPAASAALEPERSSSTDFIPQSIALMAQTLTAQTESLCQEPALSRLTRHTIASGENLDTIAQQYNLIPATLQGFNPSLRSGSAPAGTEIVIPPYNGIQVNAPAGTTWRDLAQTYRVRADALFEVNGCQDAVPSVVFVPGVNWSPTQSAPSTTTTATSNPLSGYPLPTVADVLTSYGWQLDPNTDEFVFQSGVNLQAEAGTPVLSVGAGTVAFAGEETNYGNLVVVNHSEGLQTRYAQLGNIGVQVGQQVQLGEQVGAVGASSGSSYLHFEVRSNSTLGWVAQDPGSYIPDIRSADQIRRRPQAGNGQ